MTMSRVNWSTVNQVTGHSPYVNDLVETVSLVFESIKLLVEEKKYLRNFLDKAWRSAFL